MTNETTKKPDAGFFQGVTIATEPIKTAQFGCIIGKPDSGKSWLASFAPDSFFLATEKGCELVKNNVGRFLIDEGEPTQRLRLPVNAAQFFQAFDTIVKNKGAIKGRQYKNIVIDSARFTEDLFAAEVLKENPSRTEKGNSVPNVTIAQIPFGLGVAGVLVHWDKFFAGVTALTDAGVGVILLCHTAQIKEPQPDGTEPKREKIDLARWSSVYSVPALVMARADWCYHIRKEVKTKTIANPFGGTGKTIPIDGASQEVIVWTRSTGALDAKCKTRNYEDIPDCYVIDIKDPSTSRRIFEDLAK